MKKQVSIPRPNPAGEQPTTASYLPKALRAGSRRLGPTPYEVIARWEYRMHGEVRRTIITRHITLSSEPHGPNQQVTLLSTPPMLRQPDLTALEELTVELSALYRRLVLRVSPVGQPLEVLNHAELLQTWARLAPELAARFGADGPDGLAAMLLTAVTQQLQRPEDVLASLQYDYAYGFLLKNLSMLAGGSQEQAFPHFFADTTICFQVPPAVPPTLDGGPASYHLHGLLDEQRTNRAAAAEQVAAELAPEADPSPSAPEPGTLDFAYTATYLLNADTGWPASLAATVSCQGPAGYAKEYDLTITQL